MSHDTDLYKVLRASTRTISGVFSNHGYAGQGVQVDPSDPANLIWADADTATLTGRGYQLMRDVAPQLELGTQLTYDLLPHRELARPDVIGSCVTAREVLEAEFEGAERLTLTGTGDLSAATAGTKLSYVAGKLRELQSGDTHVADIVAVLTPVSEDNDIRFRVQFIH